MVSSILLSGIINITIQHDAIEDLEARINTLEHDNLTDRSHIESLENWVLKQGDAIKEFNDKLATMDVNRVRVQESCAIKVSNQRINSLEVESRSLKAVWQSGIIDQTPSKANPKAKAKTCKECGEQFMEIGILKST